jgi:hypothetical protein
MKKGLMFGLLAAVLLGGVVSAAALTGNLSAVGLTSPIKPSPGSLVEVQSGLAASDPLNGFETQQQLQSNSSYWQYGGTSGANNSYYSFFESANQLHIGVAATNSSNWTGYYAVTPPTNASLVHAVLTSPGNGSNPGYYDIGLYMKASNQVLNYLACVAITTPAGTTWGLVHAQGTTSENAIVTPLWVDTSQNQPLTRDCTIVTNGDNSVQLYLDNVLVYHSTFLNLGMPPPYSFFIEDESLVSNQLLYGQYQGFYATTGSSVTVTNLPSSAVTVELVSPSGQVLATAPASSGKAALDVGAFSFPISGFIRAYSSATDPSNSTMVAYTPTTQQIYGGDEFAFGGHATLTSSLQVQAEDLTGHDVNGLLVSLTQGRDAVSSQYMPWTFTVNNSQTYTLTANDYGSYTFDHWSDGSTSRVLTLSVTQSTSLVAYYRDSNSPPPSGKAILSVSAVDSNGTAITGLTISLWQNGVLEGVSYSPGSFVVTPGVLYAVSVSDYGPYTFDNWGDGVSSQFHFIGVDAGTTTDLQAVFTTGSG